MKTRWIGLVVLSASVVLGLAPPAQAEVRVSPNYRLNSDSSPFRGQDQPGLAVNPSNPQHVVAVNANYLDSTCETSRSLDGGSTWSPAVALIPPAGENFVQFCNNTVGTAGYVQFGTGQTVYTAVAAQKQDAGFLQDAAALLYKSTDGGLTWQQRTVAMQGGPGGLDPNATVGPAFYRPAIAVDRGAGTNSQDRVHIVARDLRAPANGLCTTLANTCTPIRAAVSENGGQSFGAAVRVSPAGANISDFASRPVVNADHSVTVGWRVTAVTGPIQVARWTPQNGQWSAPIDVTIAVNTGTTVPSHVTPGPSASGSYPRMAGNPVTGKLYVVYSQGSTGPTAPAGGYQGADHFISPDSQVWFQRSSDNGLTWTQPKKISEQTTFPGSKTHQTRHPEISVSPNGRINVVWHDRRHWYQGAGERNCTHSHIYCEDIRLGDTYYSYSTDGGNSFVKPIRINDRSHNNEVGFDTRPSGYWWFAPQVVTIGNDQKALIAWMDSREGNWETDTEDIYLAKVDFNATGAAPQTTSGAADAVSRSVALSKVAYRGGPEGAMVGGNTTRDPANPPGCTTAQCTGGPATRNASSVVIANQVDVPGALAGAVLARANPGPVLLSPASGLPASVKAEVTRMKPARAFVIGSAGSLSEQVRTDVASAAGIPVAQVVRVSGASDAATAADVAGRMDPRTAAEKATGTFPAFDAAVIANPASPDAAAVAGLAAARRLPILYVGANSIPSETTAALDALDIDKTLVIGDSSVVSATVLGQLPSATRLGGADQYGTSQAVVGESTARGLPSNVVHVADGAKPMDAVLLGGVVARATGMLVLAPAPVYSTAAGQASAFGLNGVNGLFVAGPPAPGAPAVKPPPSNPGRGPGPGPRPTVAAFAGCPSLTANVLRGSAAGNTLKGTPAGDRIFAGAGNDKVDALAGSDCVDLEAGADRGQGRGGNDLILGGRGKDRISGGAGKDKLRGGADADSLQGGAGNDSITGSAGKDAISGGSGKDSLSGGAGNDRISARDGKRDKVNCGGGRRDVAIVDRLDRVSRNCERVRRRK